MSNENNLHVADSVALGFAFDLGNSVSAKEIARQMAGPQWVVKDFILAGLTLITGMGLQDQFALAAALADRLKKGARALYVGIKGEDSPLAVLSTVGEEHVPRQLDFIVTDRHEAENQLNLLEGLIIKNGVRLLILEDVAAFFGKPSSAELDAADVTAIQAFGARAKANGIGVMILGVDEGVFTADAVISMATCVPGETAMCKTKVGTDTERSHYLDFEKLAVFGSEADLEVSKGTRLRSLLELLEITPGVTTLKDLATQLPNTPAKPAIRADLEKLRRMGKVENVSHGKYRLRRPE